MGTRSTYRVIETYKWEDRETKITKRITKKISLMYVQFDGYPNGHPMETAAWLASGKVVNGISMAENDLIYNGAGCLAAQLVAKMKNGAGGVYMYPVNERGNCGEDYLYDIVVDLDEKTITFICYENYDRKKILYKGTPAGFVEFATKKEVEV
jgi:hypothetical protein